MRFDLSPQEIAEMSLTALGVVTLLAAAVVVTVRGYWPRVASMPEPPTNQLTGFDVLLAASVFLLLAPVAREAAALMLGVRADDAQKAGLPPEAVLGTAMWAVVTSVVLIALRRVRAPSGPAQRALSPTREIRLFGVSFLVTIAALPVCYAIMAGTEWFLADVLKIKQVEHPSILQLQSGEQPAWVIVLTALNASLFAPIVEELMFRGLLLPIIAKRLRSPIAGVVASSILFGLIHLGVPKTVPALMIFGMILGVSYLKSGTILMPIFIHVLFNLRTVATILLGAGGTHE